MSKLVELMAKWRLLLGASSDPTPEELTIICQFVYENFENLTFQDFRLAMNWAINGRLDMGFVMQKNLNTFYVSKALRLYLAEKAEIVNSIGTAKSKYEAQEQNKKQSYTPEQRAENFRGHIIDVYKNYKERRELDLLDFGGLVYDWLRRTKLLQPTQEEISVALEHGNSRYIAERQDESMRNMILKTVDKKTEDYRKKKYAREYLIAQFFEKNDIVDIIKKIHPSQFST